MADWDGQLPPSLDALYPEYLHTVPRWNDPYSEDGTDGVPYNYVPDLISATPPSRTPLIYSEPYGPSRLMVVGYAGGTVVVGIRPAELDESKPVE